VSKLCPGSGRRFRGMVAEAFVYCPVCKADSHTLGMGGLTFRSAMGAAIPEHRDFRLNLTQEEPAPSVTEK
jgi:hypothetical protein